MISRVLEDAPRKVAYDKCCESKSDITIPNENKNEDSEYFKAAVTKEHLNHGETSINKTYLIRQLADYGNMMTLYNTPLKVI